MELTWKMRGRRTGMAYSIPAGYEIRWADVTNPATGETKPWHNLYCGDKHIGAGFDRDEIKAEAQKHADRQVTV